MKRKLLFVICLIPSLILGPAYGNREDAASKAPELQRMIGQMLIVGFSVASSKSPGFLSALADLEQGMAGGILFLPQNIASRSEIVAMVQKVRQCACETMPLIAIDEEGGTVDRLGREFKFPGIPSAAEIGRASDADAKRHYTALAKKLAEVGFNLNFAPVIDLNKNPRNPAIGAQSRSFSADPAVVEKYAKIFIAEHHAFGILTSLKHFPGHGSSITDTHFAPADVQHSWSQEELAPYEHLIGAGLADTVMVGHLANSLKWGGVATQQGATAISHILRRELNFDGVVISDDLTMRAAAAGKASLAEILKSSVKAGVDLLLIGYPVDPKIEDTGVYANAAIMQGVASGEIPLESVKQSWRRIISLKQRLRSMQSQLRDGLAAPG